MNAKQLLKALNPDSLQYESLVKQLAEDGVKAVKRGKEPARANETPEGDVEKGIIGLAQMLGFKVAHFRAVQQVGGTWNTPQDGDTGYPDLTMAKKGRVIFAELKSERGRLTKEQKEWQDAIGKGAEFYVWRPQDWHDGNIEHILKGNT